MDDEEALVTAAQKGDLAAFNALVERYEERVYNLALRMLSDAEAAADAAQDTFFTAYRALHQFRGQAGSFKSWMMRIAANQCYDVLRVNQRRPTLSLDKLALDSTGDNGGSALPGVLEDTTHAANPEAIAEQHELGRHIQAALAQLPVEQRLVLVLVDIQGVSYEEAAQITASSLGTVKSRLSRARTRMRDLLAPQLAVRQSR